MLNFSKKGTKQPENTSEEKPFNEPKPPIKAASVQATTPQIPPKDQPKRPPSTPDGQQASRLFIVDEPLRVAVINLIGAGNYNNVPPVPARDVMQVVAALRTLRPYNLMLERKPAEGAATKEGENKEPQPPQPVRVYLIDEILRNTIVNLLGAGTFSRVPAIEVIRVVSVLNSLRPFDVNINKTDAKPDNKPKSRLEDDKKK